MNDTVNGVDLILLSYLLSTDIFMGTFSQLDRSVSLVINDDDIGVNPTGDSNVQLQHSVSDGAAKHNAEDTDGGTHSELPESNRFIDNGKSHSKCDSIHMTYIFTKKAT